MTKRIGILVLMLVLGIFAMYNIINVNAELKAVKYLKNKYPECNFIKAKRVISLESSPKYIRVIDDSGIEFTVTINNDDNLKDYYEDMILKRKLEKEIISDKDKQGSYNVVVLDGETTVFLEKKENGLFVQKCKEKFDNVYLEESVK